MWSDGHGVAYTQWDAGEPNDYGNREDCVAWIFPSNAWNDDNCYLARNFICTIPRGEHDAAADSSGDDDGDDGDGGDFYDDGDANSNGKIKRMMTTRMKMLPTNNDEQ